MKDPGPGCRNFQFISIFLLPVMDPVKSGYSPERLGRLPGMDIRFVADDPYLLPVPAMTVLIVIIVSPEMNIIKQ